MGEYPDQNQDHWKPIHQPQANVHNYHQLKWGRRGEGGENWEGQVIGVNVVK